MKDNKKCRHQLVRIEKNVWECKLCKHKYSLINGHFKHLTKEEDYCSDCGKHLYKSEYCNCGQ